MKRYSMVILLSLIVVVMGLIKFGNNRQTIDSGNDKTIIPTNIDRQIATPTNTREGEVDWDNVSPPPEPEEKIGEDQYPGWQLLPHPGKGFVIERYVAPLTLSVRLRGLDKKIVEKEVKGWLTMNDIDPEKINLVFNQ